MQMLKKVTLGLLVVAILLVLFAGTTVKSPDRRVDASYFFRQLEAGRVYRVYARSGDVTFRCADSRTSFVTSLPVDAELLRTLTTQKIEVKDPFDADLVHRTIEVHYSSQSENPWWLGPLNTWFPFLVLVGVWFYFLRKMQQPGQKHPVRRSEAAGLPDPATVGGYSAIRALLRELTDIAREPSRFQRPGSRLPRAALLTGASGTGKTLLARVAAREAGMPLLEMTGSEFVDLYIGTGSRRARELFEAARKAAPCVVLIDHVEVVARRSELADVDVSRREQAQALAQLLSELDALEATHRVVVLLATSNPAALDDRLLTPGRIDRQIVFGLPDQKDREAILKACASALTVDGDIDWPRLAQLTAGKTGSHLRQLVDEAALVATHNQRPAVTMTDFTDALQKLSPAPVPAEAPVA